MQEEDRRDVDAITQLEVFENVPVKESISAEEMANENASSPEKMISSKNNQSELLKAIVKEYYPQYTGVEYNQSVIGGTQTVSQQTIEFQLQLEKQGKLFQTEDKQQQSKTPPEPVIKTMSKLSSEYLVESRQDAELENRQSKFVETPSVKQDNEDSKVQLSMAQVMPSVPENLTEVKQQTDIQSNLDYHPVKQQDVSDDEGLRDKLIEGFKKLKDKQTDQLQQYLRKLKRVTYVIPPYQSPPIRRSSLGEVEMTIDEFNDLLEESLSKIRVGEVDQKQKEQIQFVAKRIKRRLFQSPSENETESQNYRQSMEVADDNTLPADHYFNQRKSSRRSRDPVVTENEKFQHTRSRAPIRTSTLRNGKAFNLKQNTKVSKKPTPQFQRKKVSQAKKSKSSSSTEVIKPAVVVTPIVQTRAMKKSKLSPKDQGLKNDQVFNKQSTNHQSTLIEQVASVGVQMNLLDQISQVSQQVGDSVSPNKVESNSEQAIVIMPSTILGEGQELKEVAKSLNVQPQLQEETIPIEEAFTVNFSDVVLNLKEEEPTPTPDKSLETNDFNPKFFKGFTLGPESTKKEHKKLVRLYMQVLREGKQLSQYFQSLSLEARQELKDQLEEKMNFYYEKIAEFNAILEYARKKWGLKKSIRFKKGYKDPFKDLLEKFKVQSNSPKVEYSPGFGNQTPSSPVLQTDSVSSNQKVPQSRQCEDQPVENKDILKVYQEAALQNETPIETKEPLPDQKPTTDEFNNIEIPCSPQYYRISQYDPTFQKTVLDDGDYEAIMNEKQDKYLADIDNQIMIQLGQKKEQKKVQTVVINSQSISSNEHDENFEVVPKGKKNTKKRFLKIKLKTQEKKVEKFKKFEAQQKQILESIQKNNKSQQIEEKNPKSQEIKEKSQVTPQVNKDSDVQKGNERKRLASTRQQAMAQNKMIKQKFENKISSVEERVSFAYLCSLEDPPEVIPPPTLKKPKISKGVIIIEERDDLQQLVYTMNNKREKEMQILKENEEYNRKFEEKEKQ